MANPLIFLAYAGTWADGHRPTWSLIQRLGCIGWDVLLRPCPTETAYEAGLRRWWGRRDLIVLEHDLDPTLRMLEDLAVCPEPVCAQAYTLRYPPEAHAQFIAMEGLLAQCSAERRTAVELHPAWQAARAWHLNTLGTAEFAHRVGMPGNWRWLRSGEACADLVGLGCTKFTRAAQQAVGTTWAAGTWRDLDSRISAAMQQAGIRAHIHWPAADHHHGCRCHAAEPKGEGA